MQVVMDQTNQRLPQADQQQVSYENSQGPSLPIKIMIGYLYFAQGIVLSIAGTITFVYPQLPDYFTLSLFSLSAIPFSFKFLTAPFLQKYSILSYGKRKTWILASQMLTNLMIFVCSFFTSLSQARVFAFLAIFMYLGLSLQDISLDALCLKQLKSPRMMSMIQGSCQSSGVIVGSLFLLKGTSIQFANWIGLSQPITTLRTILVFYSIIMLIPTILIHFRFTQSFSIAESKTMKESIFRVYSIYRYFFKKQYRYCRTIIFLFLYYQGFNFFNAGYQYQLIQHGFSRNTLNTIDNIQSVILTVLMFLIGAQANYFGYVKTFLIELGMTWIIYLYIWTFFPTNIVIVAIINFLLGFLSSWNFLLATIMCGDFPEMGVTGMLYTMNGSVSNLGKNLFIHTALLKIFPWKGLSFLGIILQAFLIIVFIPKMINLIQEGKKQIIISKEQQKTNQILMEQISTKNKQDIQRQ